MRMLPTILVGLLTSLPLSIWACSDLPNICAMNAQHHQQMQDYGRQAAENYYWQQQEQYDDEPEPQRNYPSDDPMQSRMQAATGMLDMAAKKAQHATQLMQDPRHARYINGGWDYFQDSAKPKKGEYCAAFYWKKDSLIKVSGPGGDFAGAMLTFWGADIPKPKQIEKIKVTLKQSTGEAQTVQVFNYTLPNYAYGAISFAVPSAQALFDNMLDQEQFSIAQDGKTLLTAAWQDGLAARDQLKKCVTAK